MQTPLPSPALLLQGAPLAPLRPCGVRVGEATNPGPEREAARPDPAHCSGWTSRQATRNHFDDHCSGALFGPVLQAYLDQHNLEPCSVCGLLAALPQWHSPSAPPHCSGQGRPQRRWTSLEDICAACGAGGVGAVPRPDRRPLGSSRSPASCGLLGRLVLWRAFSPSV